MRNCYVENSVGVGVEIGGCVGDKRYRDRFLLVVFGFRCVGPSSRRGWKAVAGLG